MAKRLYKIEFKIKGRGNKIYTWERFAEDGSRARISAKIALRREYPQGTKIVSVSLI